MLWRWWNHIYLHNRWQQMCRTISLSQERRANKQKLVLLRKDATGSGLNSRQLNLCKVDFQNCLDTFRDFSFEERYIAWNFREVVLIEQRKSNVGNLISYSTKEHRAQCSGLIIKISELCMRAFASSANNFLQRSVPVKGMQSSF